MELEIHQLDMRYRDLRIAAASSRRRLMAELSEAEQQSPVLVTAAREPARYVLIDGYLRVSVLKRLGHDTVRAVCLDLSESDALLWHHQRQRSQSSALEDGWLLRELRDSHGFGGVELAARLSRSPSWVSRRIALVETLPTQVQKLVRKGALCPQGAMKYLVPLARANAGHAETLSQNIASQKLSVRQMHGLYVGWRQSDAEGKERLVQQPMLYLAARAEAKTEVRAAHPDEALLSDLHATEAIMRRLSRRLRERGGQVPVGAAMDDAWAAVQHAFDALFTYLKV